MIRTIEIIVSPQGETRLETKGFAGSDCREASRQLVQTLGTAASERLTSEFHAHSSTAQPAQQRAQP